MKYAALLTIMFVSHALGAPTLNGEQQLKQAPQSEAIAPSSDKAPTVAKPQMSAPEVPKSTGPAPLDGANAPSSDAKAPKDPVSRAGSTKAAKSVPASASSAKSSPAKAAKGKINVPILAAAGVAGAAGIAVGYALGDDVDEEQIKGVVKHIKELSQTPENDSEPQTDAFLDNDEADELNNDVYKI
jgi:hypothetical protein